MGRQLLPAEVQALGSDSQGFGLNSVPFFCGPWAGDWTCSCHEEGKSRLPMQLLCGWNGRHMGGLSLHLLRTACLLSLHLVQTARETLNHMFSKEKRKNVSP